MRQATMEDITDTAHTINCQVTQLLNDGYIDEILSYPDEDVITFIKDEIVIHKITGCMEDVDTFDDPEDYMSDENLDKSAIEILRRSNLLEIFLGHEKRHLEESVDNNYQPSKSHRDKKI